MSSIVLGSEDGFVANIKVLDNTAIPDDKQPESNIS